MASEPTVTDGRRARRERGRHAVVDAMISMIEEGGSPASADEVAERAGVSVATLFRYFAGLDDLRGETIARFIERHRDLYDVPDLGRGDLPDRIDRFVAARMSLYATIAPVARFVRSRAGELPTLSRSLRERRQFMTDQIAEHFASELAVVTPSRRAELVGTVASLTSFESWDLLSGDLGHTSRRVRNGWTTALRSVLHASAKPAGGV